MTRLCFLSCLILSCLVLASCSGNPIIKPSVIQDAESYTEDALQAFAAADWYRAQQLFSSALSLYQGIDDQQGTLHSHINLAEVALSAHDNSVTRKHLDHAADIAKQIALQQYNARITLLYALNALEQQKISYAENSLQSLLPEFDGVTLSIAPNAIQLAAIATRTRIAFVQKQDESLWTLRYTNALSSSPIKNLDLEARLLRFQSSLLQRQRYYEKSESKLLQALSGYKTSLSRAGIAATLSELGALYMTQSNWQNALDYLNRSIKVFRYLGDLGRVIRITEKLVIVEAELGNLERSKTLEQWLVETKDKLLVQRAKHKKKADLDKPKN